MIPMPLEGAHHLPRLTPESYRGHCCIHWAMTIKGRATGWLNENWRQSFISVLKNHIPSYVVCIPAYCLMPDHLHLLVAGLTNTSDQRLFIRATRREMNRLLRPLKLQKEPYDHLLRPSESKSDSFAALVYYIAENPVRAGLVSRAQDWPFTGAYVPELPELDPRDANYREVWWPYWNKCISSSSI